jgi:flagellar biosynthesis protein
MSGIGPNPLAVALRYDKPRAPRVVAVGRGELGRRIVQTAEECGVPLEKNPELAEALSTIAIDDEIPVALYRAVGLVLSYILRTSGHLR